MDIFLRSMSGGAGNLAAYLAAHVLLCLLPAFFIAGAMAALIPKASITRWLGRNAPYRVSYPAAAAAGSLLAVCSCTIVPLFAGIHKKGAGLGPAITFLFFAPAGNILALAYTGSTVVRAGTLRLGGAGTLASTAIELRGESFLWVVATGVSASTGTSGLCLATIPGVNPDSVSATMATAPVSATERETAEDTVSTVPWQSAKRWTVS